MISYPTPHSLATTSITCKQIKSKFSSSFVMREHSILTDLPLQLDMAMHLYSGHWVAIEIVMRQLLGAFLKDSLQILFAPSSLSFFCLRGMQVLPFWTMRARAPPRNGGQRAGQGLPPYVDQSCYTSPGLHASGLLCQKKVKLDFHVSHYY